MNELDNGKYSIYIKHGAELTIQSVSSAEKVIKMDIVETINGVKKVFIVLFNSMKKLLFIMFHHPIKKELS